MLHIEDFIRSELSHFPTPVDLVFKYVSELPLDITREEVKLLHCDVSNGVLPKGYWLPWREYLGAWVSPDGTQVNVFIQEDVNPGQLVRNLAIGLCSVLSGFLLNFQNQVGIHGNAVFLEGQAVAFVGGSGRGKSTLSAYFAHRGASFMSDDVLFIDENRSLYPGYPQLRLCRATLEGLDLSVSEDSTIKGFQKKIPVLVGEQSFGENIPNVMQNISHLENAVLYGAAVQELEDEQRKSRFLYDPEYFGFEVRKEPAPLGMIYFPSKSSDDQIFSERIPPIKAAYSLMQRSYRANYLISQRPALLDTYLNLVSKVSVRKLYYPRRYELLPQVYDFVLEEVSQLKMKG